MTTPILGLKAATIHVKDITKARAFYTNVLGLKEIAVDPTIKNAFFAIPGSPVPLGAHQYTDMCVKMGGRPPGTVTGLVLVVNNVEKAVTDLKAKGVTITDAPAKAPWGDMIATIADPDGNEFVLTTK
jgi:catechol 2,3-dioxygenase-like lactoylglutathione lyase family enzyme